MNGTQRKVTAPPEMLAALWHSGLTLDEIAAEFGCSRERIRQHIEKVNGKPPEGRRVHGGKADRAIACVGALRTAPSFAAAGRSVGLSGESARMIARRFGMHEACQRLYRLRRIHALLSALRTAAVVLGRTPAAADMIAGTAGLYEPSAYMRAFGSIRRAQQTAGLPPNCVGRKARV